MFLVHLRRMLTFLVVPRLEVRVKMGCDASRLVPDCCCRESRCSVILE